MSAARGALPVTVVVPALNEAATIGDCVAHVADWAAGVIVVDGGSDDGTPALARAAGAVVLEGRWPSIAAQRNAGIAAAPTAWVFALDADERVPSALREEIALAMAAPARGAWRVRRRNLHFGREMRRGHWGRDWVVRLFPRERRFLDVKVHEALEPVADVGTLRAPLDHVPYRDLAHQLDKMNRYARWGAEELYARGRRAGPVDLLGRPVGRFLRAYFLSGHVRDGTYGLLASMLGATGVFLKYAHLWALGRERRR